MSHELRTPLNAIIDFSEIMTSGVFGAVESDRYRSYAADIHTSALHLLDIINDILDLARIEAGKAEFHERSLPLIETVEQVLNLTGEQIEQASLSLVRDIDPDLPRVQADERAMRQILLNLISNAIKFTPRGGTITIGLRYEASGGVRLWVADTGIGIAPEDVSKLMRPFTQLDDVYRRRYQGTGLGLALVRSLTELHDGSVAIETAPGRGTTVTVSLPASRVVVALPGAANHA
ncbi:MAG: HAMP domain-containing histidine kinase [Proteobacteria bacterium]|nr:HAMP domain-containing histidine kinase [Pseudomonadota bacterium]